MHRSIILTGFLLLGCSPTPQSRAASDLVAGGSCLRTQLIRQSFVRDASTIDFEMKSGVVIRNRLGGACPGLGPTRSIAYRNYRNRLCTGDLVTLLPASGPVAGPTCTLGQFESLGPRAAGLSR